jgi:hypothetical protein
MIIPKMKIVKYELVKGKTTAEIILQLVFEIVQV